MEAKQSHTSVILFSYQTVKGDRRSLNSMVKGDHTTNIASSIHHWRSGLLPTMIVDDTSQQRALAVDKYAR